MENIFISIVLFFIGSCFGSFLSVVISRSLEGKKGIVAGRSACPHCHHQLKFWNLIPIFSWIFQKGNCTFCHKKISPIYPALELATGLLFLNNFFFLQFSYFPNLWDNHPATLELFTVLFWIKFIYLGLINLALLSLCFSDLQKKLIPNSFLYFWIAICLPIPFLSGENPIYSILAILLALTFFGGQYMVSKGHWLGSGDIYIAVGMALLLGFKGVILAIVCSYLIGASISILLLLLQKIKVKKTIAFAPFLCLGTLIAIYLGSDLITWYLANFLYL